MGEVKYLILGTPDTEGKVTVRRLSDNTVSRCKASWLKPDTLVGAPEGLMVAKNNTKALRLDGLTWTMEG